jgi:MFS family permease
VNGPLGVLAFRWLFAGQVVSAFGDQLFPVAIAALVVTRGGTAGELGLVLAARFAALVLFALLGGVWADRLPRVRLMRAADLLRLLAVGGIAAAAAGEPPVALLASLVFLVGAGEAFFRPAYGAVLPTVLPPEQLARANGLTGISSHVAQVAGPGVAGLLLLVTGPAGVLVLDALTFVVSLLTLVHVSEPARVVVPRRRLHVEVLEGVAAVRARPWIAGVLAMAAVQLMLVVAPVTVLLPVVVRDSGAPASAYGLVLAVGGLGGVLGAVAAARWSPPRAGVVAMLLLLLWALPPLALLAAAPPGLLAAAFFAGMLGLGPFNVWWETALQRSVPPELLARVVSLDWLCSFALLPLGLALTGPAVALVGRGPLLGLAAATMVGTSLLVLLVPGVGDLGASERPGAARR